MHIVALKLVKEGFFNHDCTSFNNVVSKPVRHMGRFLITSAYVGLKLTFVTTYFSYIQVSSVIFLLEQFENSRWNQ